MPQLIPDNSLGFALTDVARLSRQAFEKAFAHSGLDLTAGEIRALAYVARYPASRQAALAERMGVEPMTLSAYLDRLEARGLIKRSPDAYDRRAKTVSVTGEAEGVFTTIRPLVMQVYARMTGGIDPADLKTLERCLALMRQNMMTPQDQDQRPAPADVEAASGNAAETSA